MLKKKYFNANLKARFLTGKQTKYWIWDNDNFYCYHYCHVPGRNWLKTGVSSIGERREKKVLKLREGTDSCIQLYLAVDETIPELLFFISRIFLNSHRSDFTNKC